MEILKLIKMDYTNLEGDCLLNNGISSLHLSTEVIATMVVLGIIDLVVIVGNSLVIAAVITARKLRTVTNIFIVSLACADLMLGFAVLPFSISLEVFKTWYFGNVWCSIWLAIDVWLCTASILNLCAISLDRYIAVTRPIRYPRLMCAKRGRILVSSVWALSFIICLPPLIGWNETPQNVSDTTMSTLQYNSSDNSRPQLDTVFLDSMATNGDYDVTNSTNCEPSPAICELTSTLGYRIYAALGSFFIPMLIMVFFYFQIFRVAIKTASSLRSGVLTTKQNTEYSLSHDDKVVLRIHRGGSRISKSFKEVTPSRSPRRENSDRTHSHMYPIRSNRHQLVRGATLGSRDIHHSKSKGRMIPSPIPGCRWENGRNVGQTNALQQNIQKSHSENELRENACYNTMDVCNGTKSVKNGHTVKSIPVKKNKHRPHWLPRDSRMQTKNHIKKFNRETKAAKTLAIIVGAFILCWLPFFTIYLIGAFCQSCVPPLVFSIFFWLGYCNSALNPFIYGMFSRDFRSAFIRLLLCKKQKGLRRSMCPENRSFSNNASHMCQTFDSESFSDT